MSEENGQETKLESVESDLCTKPPTEEEMEFEMAFDACLVKDGLTKAMKNIKAQPRTEYLDLRMTAYRKEVRAIDDWVADLNTPTPRLNTAILDELDISELLGKKSILFRRLAEASNKDQNIEHTTPSQSSPSIDQTIAPIPPLNPLNFFHRENNVFQISYHGEIIRLAVNQPLRELAERLKFPGIEKVLKSETELVETDFSFRSEQEEAIGDTQCVNDRVSPEFKLNIENKTKSLCKEKDLAEEQLQLSMTHKLSRESLMTFEGEVSSINTKLDKIKVALRGFNGVLHDDGSITWGSCMDKSNVSRQKDALYRNLKRAVTAIKNGGGEKLAEHLEKHLLPEKTYRPPPEEDQFEVFI